MASYIVMEPAADRRGEAALFIRDAFAPLAVVVPVPWLLWNRLWFEAAMALCASLILTGAAIWIGAPQLSGIGSILMGFYVALEGGALKIAAVRRQGFEDAATVDARSVGEAEERYYLTRPSVPEPPMLTVSPPVTPRQASASGAGLFALPGAH
jgi:hypothetical protein